MLARYVLADLTRNPRRTLSTMLGVTLGVGLFCGILFFVDGLSASMTQRAVAPLTIDMQRIVTERVGGALILAQRFDPAGAAKPGDQIRVILEVRNPGDVTANEVTVRSVPNKDLQFVAGSARLDGAALGGSDNPFARGAGPAGYNLGVAKAGATTIISFVVEAQADVQLTDASVNSSFSSRESVIPVRANTPSVVPLDDLAQMVAKVEGVAAARQLSLVDLGPGSLSANGRATSGPAKLFGLDADYAAHDPTIKLIEGGLTAHGAVLSVEASRALQAKIGDKVTIALADSTRFDVVVNGIADLSQARSLFASRRGSDLETFIYAQNSMIVSPAVFADKVIPAFERAATARGSRLKNLPVREIDVTVDRRYLNSDPATALIQTKRIAAAVSAVAEHQDFLIDNISNTLDVATGDSAVAKRLFIFLGVPGGFLAALLAGYAGNVLADAQRREQATLRIRGASRRHLLRMLAIRTAGLSAAGSLVGLLLGYLLASAILGRASLARATTSRLALSALLGCLGGFLATGLALYMTGRRTIDREINEDRARLSRTVPLWRRARLDIVGCVVVVVGTAVALRAHAFDGASGSVYFGRSVTLNLSLLVLPIAVWFAGSLVAARVVGTVLHRTQPVSTGAIGAPLPSLYRLSVGRRPWAIGNGAIIVTLIVALSISLAGFTSSYDAAKANDARYATGSDIRIVASPTARHTYTADQKDRFRTDGVAQVSPVVYSIRNVILRSARTSDPANLAAIDPSSFGSVSSLRNDAFATGDAAAALRTLHDDPGAVLLSSEMAQFLRAKPGDVLHVLMARGTDAQIEVDLHITGLFERLPGFPDGADALMAIDQYIAHVPAKAPDFFLASTTTRSDADLHRAMRSLSQGPAAADALQITTRATTIARDQSSLAALNIAGLVDLDSTFALAMEIVTIAIFVFGLLLQRRREYVTLRAQGLDLRTIRLLIAAEAGTVAIVGATAGVLVGTAMGYYFVTVLRPLFVLSPAYTVALRTVLAPIGLVLAATVACTLAGARLVNRLEPTELLRDE